MYGQCMAWKSDLEKSITEIETIDWNTNNFNWIVCSCTLFFIKFGTEEMIN